MSSSGIVGSAGGELGEGGVVDLGGVEGGEGNKVGRLGEGGEGACLFGEEQGKNKTGLTGEGKACFVGEEDVASLVGEEGSSLVGEEGERAAGKEVWVGLVGDEGEGQERGVEGVVQVKIAGGPEGETFSEYEQGVAEGDVGDVLISGGVKTGKEVAGKFSVEGEGEKLSELTGAEGRKRTLSAGE